MRRANALWLVGFLALYLAGGLAAQAFGESNVATPWYPPAGLALALVTLRGVRWAPAIAIGEALVAWLAFGISGGVFEQIVNALVPAVAYGAAGGALRALKLDPRFRRRRDVSYFAIVGAVAAPLVSALLGTLVARAYGEIDADAFGATLRTLFLGDAVAVATITPVVLQVVASPRLPRPSPSAIAQGLAWTVAVVAAPLSALLLSPSEPLDYIYLGFVPVLVVSALHGVRAAALATFVASLTVVLTLDSELVSTDALLELQGLLLALSLTALLVGSIVSGRHVAEGLRIAAENELLLRALRDELTGLPNRAALRQRLETVFSALAERTLVVVDIDDQRVVNASFGYVFGDQLLVAVGRRLEEIKGDDDFLAHEAGDVFALLVDGGPSPRAAADRVHAALAQPLEIDGRLLYVRAHVAAVPVIDAGTIGELGRRTSAAMEQAKRSSVERTGVYDRRLAAQLADRLQIATDMRTALEQPERWGLRFGFQPIVETATGRIVSFESLLRWQHPARGALLPAQVIPAVEEGGLVMPFGSWTLRAAARQAAAWQDRGVTVGVNVAAPQLIAPGFLDELRSALEEHGTRPEALGIEVLESMLVEAPEFALATLREVRELGCSVYIDDFGTGYSSLSYLRDLPVDVLKLDISFIAPICDAARDRMLVERIVDLAHALELVVVAEGVETDEQREALLSIGCDRCQGWLFAKAMPAADADRLLEDGVSCRPRVVS